MKEKKTYYEELNIFKGIAIFLVVLGHAITQTGQQGIVLQGIYSIIYSFHMPAFFFASGFLAYRLLDMSTPKERVLFAYSKTKRLLVPYFFMGTVYLLVTIGLTGAYWFFSKETYINMLTGANPDSELWFLYVLWFIFIICSFAFVKSHTILWLLGTFLVSYWVQFHNFGTQIVSLIAYYLFFFICGITVKQFYQDIKKVIHSDVVLVICVISLICGFYDAMKNQWIFRCPLIIALLACFWLLNTSKHITLLSEKNILRKTTHILGNYCMDIYIIAEPMKSGLRMIFWDKLHWNYLLCTLICLVIPIISTIVISKYIIRKNKISSFWILGDYK